MVLHHGLEIVQLTWNRTCRYDLYLSIIVYQDTVWMHIPYFPLYSLKLVSCSDHVVQEVPDFPLLKEAVYLKSILDFSFKDVW